MKSQKHILIVDDESNIRLMLKTTLTSVGYSVEEAVDGREALDAIERRVPEVMILDLSMPRLDGIGVLNELKGMPPERKPRVIVLTAYGSIPVAVKATRLGAMDFIEKPVSPDEVRESVEAVLNEVLPKVHGTSPVKHGWACGAWRTSDGIECHLQSETAALEKVACQRGWGKN